MVNIENKEVWLLQGTLSLEKQRENIILIIKRLFGEHATSMSVITQNSELPFRCTAYNMHRLTNLVSIVMVSTWPCRGYLVLVPFSFRSIHLSFVRWLYAILISLLQ